MLHSAEFSYSLIQRPGAESFRTIDPGQAEVFIYEARHGLDGMIRQKRVSVVVNPPSGSFLRVYDSLLPWNFSPTEMRAIGLNSRAARKRYGSPSLLYPGEAIDKTIHGMAGEARVLVAQKQTPVEQPRENRVYEDVYLPQETGLPIGGQTEIRYNSKAVESFAYEGNPQSFAYNAGGVESFAYNEPIRVDVGDDRSFPIIPVQKAA